MDAQIFAQKQNDVARQLAMLRAADKNPDLKISGGEIETTFVRDWATKNPEDKGLAKLEGYVRGAMAFRTKVDAAYAQYQQARGQGKSVDPLTELLAVTVATAIGVAGQPGHGDVPDKDFLAAKLRLLSKQSGSVMTVEAIRETVNDVAMGVRNTRALEGNLERAVPGLRLMLDDNRAELEGVRAEQRRQQGNTASATRERARDAIDRRQVQAEVLGSIPPEVLATNPALKAQLEGVMKGNGSAKDLRPEDLAKIQGNKNLSAATKQLFAQGAGYDTIREQMMREVEARIDADLAKNGPGYAQRAQGQLQAQAAVEYPKVAEGLLTKRTALARQYGEHPNEAQQAILGRLDESIANVVGGQDKARKLIEGFAANTQGAMSNARQIAAAPEPQGAVRENPHQLTPEQLAAVAAMREQIAKYSVEPSVRPTAQGVLNAIGSARAGGRQ